MRKLFTRRVGSAHLIGLAALVLALTGTSIALPGTNTVGSRDIKPRAVHSSDVARNTLNGRQINERKVGTVPKARRAINIHWVVVTNPNGAGNASVVRSSAPVPSVTEATAVRVDWGFNVTGCSWTATRSSPGNSAEPAGFAQADAQDGNPEAVEVRTRDAANGAGEDGNFHLLVVC
jgi:hypothetical protein